MGCHQPCWLALWKTTINNVTALINTYSLDQHACWWEPWPSPGYHGNTQGREECLQLHSRELHVDTSKLWTQLRKGSQFAVHTFWVALMFLSKIFDNLQLSFLVGQREWGVTSLVDCTCKHQWTVITELRSRNGYLWVTCYNYYYTQVCMGSTIINRKENGYNYWWDFLYTNYLWDTIVTSKVVS